MSWSTDMVPLSPTLGDEGDKTCRVCRSGEEPGSPLYKPCKCSGSISWIHQDCLESWLSVSRAQRCELCKHPFKWEKGEFVNAVNCSGLDLATWH